MVGHSLAKAGAALKEEIEGPTSCKLSLDKAASTSTSPVIMDTLRSALGRLAGEGKGAVRSLGIDFSGGNCMARAGRRVRQESFRKLKVRSARLRLLTQGVGGKGPTYYRLACSLQWPSGTR